MTRNPLPALLALASFASCISLAQNQTVTAHFEVVRDGNKAKLKDSSNVVAWLTPVVRPANVKTAYAGQGASRLVQKNKTFSPHVLAVTVGSIVEFPNRDPFFHNVF